MTPSKYIENGRSRKLCDRVAFENSNFIAVDKPAGTLVIPGRPGEDVDKTPVLLRELERDLGKKLWVCHRVDREVSGLVLFARSPEAHRAANAWFEGREIKKSYEALLLTSELTGHVAPHTEIADKILRGKKRAYESPEGKEAVTLVGEVSQVRSNGNKAVKLILHPQTGRGHQLRFHCMKTIGPIWGDELYGSKTPFPEGGIALRAVELDFSRCEGAVELGLARDIRLGGFHSEL